MRVGIPLTAAHLLTRSLGVLGDLSQCAVLTLGVQDCHFDYEQIVRFLHRHDVAHKAIPVNEVLRTTGFAWVDATEREKYRNFIHQQTFFRLLGLENVLSMDFSAFEGADIAHDLNLPVEDSLFSKFDLIFDGGTLEHVFSTKDVLFNLCRMCKIGGVVIHISPVDCVNHGFINVNASLFRDFYRRNGFEQIDLKYISSPSHPKLAKRYYLEFSPDSYRNSLQPFYATSVWSVFRKCKEVSLEIPNQEYYDNMWAGRAISSAVAPTGQRFQFSRILRARIRNWVDKYLPLCLLVRAYINIRKGRRIYL